MHLQHGQTHITPSISLPKSLIGGAPAVLPAPDPSGWKPASMSRPAPPSAPARCSEKGCVFPGAPGSDGKCLHHLRQTREPILFSSYQPTRAVLDRGRFGIPDEEVDASRTHDRRKLAAIREAFLED